MLNHLHPLRLPVWVNSRDLAEPGVVLSYLREELKAHERGGSRGLGSVLTGSRNFYMGNIRR